MTSDLTLELERATNSAFEQLGFLLPDRELTEEQIRAPLTASCRIPFRGPRVGALEVQVAGNVLGNLALNMMGEEEEITQEILLDALGEISNVICGNFLPALGGMDAVFDLSTPEAFPQPLPEGKDGREAAAKAVVGLESGRVELTMRLSR